jgi:hypothetical protein
MAQQLLLLTTSQEETELSGEMDCREQQELIAHNNNCLAKWYLLK